MSWHYELECISHIIVPRLKWSDRDTEKYEQKRRVFNNDGKREDSENERDKRKSKVKQEVICGL